MTAIESLTLDVPDSARAEACYGTLGVSAQVGVRAPAAPALAKDAGVSPEGTGPHRIVIGGAAGPFTDPDAFAGEPA